MKLGVQLVASLKCTSPIPPIAALVRAIQLEECAIVTILNIPMEQKDATARIASCLML